MPRNKVPRGISIMYIKFWFRINFCKNRDSFESFLPRRGQFQFWISNFEFRIKLNCKRAVFRIAKIDAGLFSSVGPQVTAVTMWQTCLLSAGFSLAFDGLSCLADCRLSDCPKKVIKAKIVKIGIGECSELERCHIVSKPLHCWF